jgi:delta-aminolevulinic acid dehydratase/porphobilinogen synthase
MLKAAAERGWLNERDAALEALTCFRRAGERARSLLLMVEAAGAKARVATAMLVGR